MGVLTKKERDGLEDVFLSIHSHNDDYKRLKTISALIMLKTTEFSMNDLLKHAKYRLKETKLSLFLSNYPKKKKNLSK
jgi:hypothetical protein